MPKPIPYALIADSDADHNAQLSAYLQELGWDTCVALTCTDARNSLDARTPNLLLLSLTLPDGAPLQLINEADHIDEVVVMNEADNPDLVKKAVAAGACYFFVKPFDQSFLGDLLTDLAAELDHGHPQETEQSGASLDQFGMLRGSSKRMKQLYRMIRKVAPTDASVLIVGASGTGKELVAQTIHQMSARHDGPLVAMNCGAIPHELIESELFGHEKGAFTGATSKHHGYFERAHGGTLFLDEITEMPMELQVKLLRVLETGAFRRVGGESDLTSDVRIVAATNRDPDDAMTDNRLREDLYYRIARFPLHVPPLRKRGSDIIGLAKYFLSAHNEHDDRHISLSDAACDALRDYPWPGNVRELLSCIERAYVLANNSIDADMLALAPATSDNDAADGHEGQTSRQGLIEITVGDSIDDAERELILATLESMDGDKKAAAEVLGISLKTLYNRLNEYDRSS